MNNSITLVNNGGTVSVNGQSVTSIGNTTTYASPNTTMGTPSITFTIVLKPGVTGSRTTSNIDYIYCSYSTVAPSPQAATYNVMRRSYTYGPNGSQTQYLPNYYNSSTDFALMINSTPVVKAYFTYVLGIDMTSATTEAGLIIDSGEAGSTIPRLGYFASFRSLNVPPFISANPADNVANSAIKFVNFNFGIYTPPPPPPPRQSNTSNILYNKTYNIMTFTFNKTIMDTNAPGYIQSIVVVYGNGTDLSGDLGTTATDATKIKGVYNAKDREFTSNLLVDTTSYFNQRFTFSQFDLNPSYSVFTYKDISNVTLQISRSGSSTVNERIGPHSWKLFKEGDNSLPTSTPTDGSWVTTNKYIINYSWAVGDTTSDPITWTYAAPGFKWMDRFLTQYDSIPNHSNPNCILSPGNYYKVNLTVTNPTTNALVPEASITFVSKEDWSEPMVFSQNDPDFTGEGFITYFPPQFNTTTNRWIYPPPGPMFTRVFDFTYSTVADGGKTTFRYTINDDRSVSFIANYDSTYYPGKAAVVIEDNEVMKSTNLQLSGLSYFTIYPISPTEASTETITLTVKGTQFKYTYVINPAGNPQMAMYNYGTTTPNLLQTAPSPIYNPTLVDFWFASPLLDTYFKNNSGILAPEAQTIVNTGTTPLYYNYTYAPGRGTSTTSGTVVASTTSPTNPTTSPISGMTATNSVPPAPVAPGAPGAAGSGTCFPAGTPVQTDQGLIAIDKIDPEYNTINNKKIVAVTKTVASEAHIIQLEQNAIGPNYPSQTTQISQLHALLYNGKMTRAKDIPEGKRIQYNGETLYNVLLENHETMIINNLIVETLNPRNNIAILYKHITTNNLSTTEQNRLINLLNNKLEACNNLRKQFFSNIIFIILLDVLTEKPVLQPTPTAESVRRAFLPEPICI